MGAPPWLRFQAYVVGLPKTGSTSLATAFGAYRTGHEVSRRELVAAGLQWQAGRFNPDEFWDVTTPRLTKPWLEMDSATCHHLYAPLLAQRFPRAVFIHTVRDVGGWISSLLDMLLRGRYVREIFLMLSSEAEQRYMDEMLGGRLDAWFDPMAGDRSAVVPLMQYWSRHMREMAAVLPADRTKVVRTAEIGRSLPLLADLCGVSAGTLRGDLAHANRAAYRLNRFALYGDDELRDAYEMYCADIMAELFPQEHAAAFRETASRRDWETHCQAVRASVYAKYDAWG
jgi:hypothetical protein